jgi:hypothetical protein
MVGANPKSGKYERTARVGSPGAPSPDGAFAVWHRAGSHRWRWIAVLSVFVPLSFILVQCGKVPSAGMLAANASTGDTFEDRFPAPQFKDRFPTESETIPQRQPAGTAQAEAAPYRVASLAPTVPYERPAREEQTTLVALKSSAFPYLGNNPRTDEPFLNISRGERRGHRGLRGRVFWQDETFNDNRVLMHVPESFDAGKPGVIVVFFHGNGATLERDVRDRQLVPQQISASGVNAVLLAPQLAVDAADSSAGKFWQPGGLKRFVTESADHLARLYGDPCAADLRQHARHHRRLQRRLHAGGLSLEVGASASRAAYSCSTRSMANSTVRVLDRQQLHWLCQRLYLFHQTARRTDGDAEGKGHRDIGRYRRTAAARQRGLRRDARRRDASRLRHPRLDQIPRQGCAGEDGGNAGADESGGNRAVARQPITDRFIRIRPLMKM